MIKMQRRRRTLAALIVLAAVVLVGTFGSAPHWRVALNSATASLVSGGREVDQLLLLVADDTPAQDPAIMAWQDAASEEGLHLRVMTASEFLRPRLFGRRPAAGIILPDGVHRRASDPFVDQLIAEVAQGTPLMVVFDGASLDINGAWLPGKSRLSHVVGADYALYDRLKGLTMRPTTVLGSAAVMSELGLPPGRYAHTPAPPGEYEKRRDGAGPDERQLARQAPTDAAQADSGSQTITSYQYEISNYAHFVTDKNLSARPLLLGSDGGLVAGRHQFGKGMVLFVNLPLSYLKLRSDGMFLHTFLQYFATHMLELPYLAAAPRGIGGIVMNWHIDSNAALPALERLSGTGVFEQGPYSVHFTTGPDTYKPGDGSGLDALHNPDAQRWMKFFIDRGDTVGSHGGWIHNYFGLNVSEDNQEQFEPYLARNKSDIEAITHREVTEYSAPVGNHPGWTTRWLAAHGIRAYYFTGNLGMGPTRTYRNGMRADHTTWSFPVDTYGRIAAFEEAHYVGIPESEIAAWLVGLNAWCSDHHFVRLIYFHPEGLLHYESAVKAWLANAQQLRDQRRMAWYTMTEIADFMTQRALVHWRLAHSPDGKHAFRAVHPANLATYTWAFPKSRFERPTVTRGTGTVGESWQNWLLVAGDGMRLEGTIVEKKRR